MVGSPCKICSHSVCVQYSDYELELHLIEIINVGYPGIKSLEGGKSKHLMLNG